MIRYRVAEILFHHCTQSPHDTRFTPIWLHRAYDAVHPNDTVSRDKIRSAIEHLINVTAVSTSTPTPPAAPRTYPCRQQPVQTGGNNAQQLHPR